MGPRAQLAVCVRKWSVACVKEWRAAWLHLSGSKAPLLDPTRVVTGGGTGEAREGAAAGEEAFTFK